MASDDCAVGPDGRLLDALQINWYNDPDDNEPMAPATSSSTAQHQCQVSVTMLNSFVTKGPPAAHWSTHAPCPSTKAIDPNNVMALKRKPSNTAIGKCPCCPCLVSLEGLDHDEDEATDPNPTDTDNDEPVDPEAVYKETKALGDADCEVSVCKSFYCFYLTLCKGYAHKV